MKARRLFLGATAAVMGSAAFVPLTAKAAAFEYKLGHDQPTSHPLNVAATEFATAVRNESNGRVNIRVFPDSTLGSDPSMVVQVREGVLEMHLQGVGPLSAVSPIASIGLTGFAFQQWRTATAAMDGAVGAIVRKDLETKGLVVMEKTWPNGFAQLTTWNRPVRNADDLAGLKLRVPLGPIAIALWKALGASPASINTSELYSALQTHVIDGNVGPLIDFLARKTYEVQKYLNVTNHTFAVYFFLVNAEKWQALPSDLQQIVRRNANLYGAREQRDNELQGNAAADLLVRRGMQLTRADTATFRARLGGYYATWKNEFGPTAWAALEQYTGKLG